MGPLGQSDRLPAVSRMPPEGMGEDSILKAPAFVGMWIHQVVFGLHRRRHMSGGPRMIKKYSCDCFPTRSVEIHVPQMFSPGFLRWGGVCRRVQASGRLLPNPTVQNFTARVRGAGPRIGYEKAEELGARSLKGGAIWSILESGGSFAQLLRGGQWRSSTFRLFLDLGDSEGAAMARVIIEASDEEAEAGGPGGERTP